MGGRDTSGNFVDPLHYIVYNTGMRKRSGKAAYNWDGQKVQALRRHLGLTQKELSERLGTRQQTISEWETGMYQPRGASATLLNMVAEQSAFSYDVSPPEAKP